MMRVTHKMMVENAIRYMDENLERLGALQEKVSDGKAIHKLSDDPATLQAILSLRSNLNAGKAYLNTANQTAGWMEANENALGAAVETAAKALDLAMFGLSDTNGVDERDGLSIEIGGLLDTAVGVANSTYNGGYIFSGFQIRTKPFELIAGSPDTIIYSGDANIITRSLSPGIDMAVNIDGDAVFTPVLEAMIAVRDALAGKVEAGQGDLGLGIPRLGQRAPLLERRLVVAGVVGREPIHEIRQSRGPQHRQPDSNRAKPKTLDCGYRVPGCGAEATQ